MFGIVWTTAVIVWWRSRQKPDEPLDMTVLTTIRPLNPIPLNPPSDMDVCAGGTHSPMSVVFDDDYLKPS